MIATLGRLALLIGVLATGHFSVAQTSSQTTTTTTTTTTTKGPQKRATVTFDDELVEGTSQKPELFYLFQKKNFNYKRLIKLRENFLPEMRRTTEDIQRVRGGN